MRQFALRVLSGWIVRPAPVLVAIGLVLTACAGRRAVANGGPGQTDRSREAG